MRTLSRHGAAGSTVRPAVSAKPQLVRVFAPADSRSQRFLQPALYGHYSNNFLDSVAISLETQFLRVDRRSRTFLTKARNRGKQGTREAAGPNCGSVEYAMSTSQHSPLPVDLAGVGSADGCLLTADEVAAILRVPRSWIYSHLSELPVIRLGRYVRFKRSEVERFLENRGPCQ